MSTKNIIFTTPDDDLKTLVTIFHINKISHVPVVNDNKLVGIVSKTDLADFLYRQYESDAFKSIRDLFTETKVKSVMTQPIVEAQITDPTMTLFEKVMSHHVGSVVLKDGDKLAGIVTEKDLLHYFVKNHEEDLSFTEKFTHHLAQWLDKNGIIRISTMLADIGI